ncbi:MAG TPA: hypothetical protein VLE74_01670 [Candidatus Saccharimonadales bacterium]|nr:hypothetical protein [Candidatus Saccharimonadales bacterium]
MSTRETYKPHLDLSDMRLLGRGELDIFREWRVQNDNKGYFDSRLEEARMDTVHALGNASVAEIRAVTKDHAAAFAASAYPEISIPEATLQTVSAAVVLETDLTVMLALEKGGMDALLVPEESAVNRLVVLSEHSDEVEAARRSSQGQGVPHVLIASQTLVRALVEVNSFASPIPTLP